MPRRKNREHDVTARLSYYEVRRRIVFSAIEILLLDFMEATPQLSSYRDLYVKLKNLMEKYK